jgi:signal transduction histidine kinase
VTKDKFFTIISHDLKNPVMAQRNALQSLINNAEILDKDTLIGYYTELLKSVDGQVELLYNLLGWAQLETGRMSVHPDVFDLKLAINAEMKLLQLPLASKNITLSCSFPENTLAFADKTMIGTVVRNLLSNAIKFTHVDGEIELAVTEQKDTFVVSIKDSGIGMTSETRNKLFHIDSQYSASGTEGESGSGLGLVVCKELVEKNGGTLTVESEEGKGTTFRFTVPEGK